MKAQDLRLKMRVAADHFFELMFDRTKVYSFYHAGHLGCRTGDPVPELMLEAADDPEFKVEEPSFGWVPDILQHARIESVEWDADRRIVHLYLFFPTLPERYRDMYLEPQGTAVPLKKGETRRA